ncbi:MAG: Na+/H+ antiporter NhaC family protein, partial [Halarsenatibacteraceae bacterium]
MAKEKSKEYEDLPRMPTMTEAIIPILFLIAMLSLSIIVLEIDPHIPIVLSAAFAAIVSVRIGISWDVIEEGIFDGIRTGLQAVIILMIVGMLIGSWIQSGIVPTMIYYGLQLLSPQIFLVASAIMTAIVALFVGSSWSTAGTIGVALVGIGAGLGIPPGLVGGSIISGAYLGDKISPLSDTTNLAPGAAGNTDVFEHVRHMLMVSAPAFIITLVLYAIIGMQFAGQELDLGAIQEITSTLSANFWISPLLMLVPLLIIVMIVLKVPPIPALLGGAVIGGITAMIAQGTGLGDVLNTMHYGFSIETGVG